MRQKFYKRKEEETEEEKNMDLNKSIEKMNIDEELSINQLTKPEKINYKKSKELSKKDEL
jgi:hypothetical protein